MLCKPYLSISPHAVCGTIFIFFFFLVCCLMKKLMSKVMFIVVNSGNGSVQFEVLDLSMRIKTKHLNTRLFHSIGKNMLH
ncbi:hypothetical protein Ahy_A03g016997 isoform E [Arachis hypogaea]|uniref:Uncharacterized protein n=1 Tax=Arachis hypogaea TaxID=3818 RepID=A0A445E502_ARAHY|nr:hypothetical protein Ahy_A03g016997 isoform E [Arachis hypogaea]